MNRFDSILWLEALTHRKMFLALADSKTPDKKHPSSSTTHQACLVDIPALVRLVDIKEIELQGKKS